MTIEQRAEDIVRAMVSQSWNEEIETIANLLRELEAAKKVASRWKGIAKYYRRQFYGPLAWQAGRAILESTFSRER